MPFIDAGDPDREWKIGVAEGGPDGLWGVTAGPRGSSWDSTAMAATKGSPVVSGRIRFVVGDDSATLGA
jgi:hypothetical protein